MKITDITRTKRGRYAIHVDGEFLFSAEEEALLRSGLKAGDEAGIEDLEALRRSSEYIFGREKAFRLLRSKLYDMELEKRQNSEAEERRSQIGTGDRSEKIRTYNFPQGRVTDHRIKLTLYKIDSIMNGDIQELLDNLIAADQSAKLAKMNEE